MSPSKNRVPFPIQMRLDFGQKDLGATRCVDCGMVYNKGDKEDDKLHKIHHRKIVPDVAKLPRGRSQRILEEYFDGSRIVELVLNSTVGTSYFSRIARLMARDLGCDHSQGEGDFITHGETCCTSVTKIPKDWRVFACVQDVSQHVIGCAVVQELTPTLIKSKAYKLRVLPGGISDLLTWTVQAKDVHGSLLPNNNQNTAPPASDNPTSLGPVLCGVRRLWVNRQHRRKGVATKLLDCVLRHLVYAHPLTRKHIAFSDLTADGASFAAKFTGHEKFLIY
ncbi:hypothetical protein X801_02546 [Opisthorchis viverrini]|uniref:Uncharacterized protein n=2 Tax=Opisthorchis viverrini TaxID=6198 RepID=A0A074ZR06_OPIVI|nr:hypothetical protein T265_13630 [Opisthorchis viverrini]KER28242.1 hypothetical protein T265_13630 [Opisthorchis viverrini]OON21554.1 hypothetical protein X801_02546 [Opisthorchis viverrini]